MSFEAIPLGTIKCNGAGYAQCVSNTGSHVLLPEPWALKALNTLIKKKSMIWERLIKCFLVGSITVSEQLKEQEEKEE